MAPKLTKDWGTVYRSSLDKTALESKSRAMFWLLRKLLFWGVIVALAIWLLQMPYNGRPLKDYIAEFYHSPLMQEGVRFTKTVTREQLDKFYKKRGQKPLEEKPMEEIDEEARQDLEKIIEQESKK